MLFLAPLSGAGLWEVVISPHALVCGKEYPGCTLSSKCLDVYLTSVNSREQNSEGARQWRPSSKQSAHCLSLSSWTYLLLERAGKRLTTQVFLRLGVNLWLLLFFRSTWQLKVPWILLIKFVLIGRLEVCSKSCQCILFICFAEFLLLFFEVARGGKQSSQNHCIRRLMT